jgi:D-alanyl-lipoteichoic acid acyltransferase DltB (MBOAT superfamily)
MISGGLILFVWGLFKKVVIADQAAKVVDLVFQPNAAPGGLAAWLGVYAFAIQIFGDFSGYTDMARGIAQMLGFNLSKNFHQPYLATNPSDFWQRWHITLSTWVRDYLYIPLGGNRGSTLRTYRNLFITMLLAGLWHGASWMFVIWSAYHAALLITYRWYKENLQQHLPSFLGRIPKKFKKYLSVFVMFHLTCIGWVFFRSPSLETAGNIFTSLLKGIHASVILNLLFFSAETITIFLMLIAIISLYAWNHRGDKPQWGLESVPGFIQFPSILLLIAGVFLFGILKAKQFIYFQF